MRAEEVAVVRILLDIVVPRSWFVWLDSMGQLILYNGGRSSISPRMVRIPLCPPGSPALPSGAPPLSCIRATLAAPKAGSIAGV